MSLHLDTAATTNQPTKGSLKRRLFGRSTEVALSALLCASISLAQAPSVPVPESFFGMHVHDLSVHWPIVPIGSLGRQDGLDWPYLEATKGNFNWAKLDAEVANAHAHGIPVYYATCYVPPWAAADKSSCTRAPNDSVIRCTSTVANIADWENFITALVTRYRGRIEMYELWNEPGSVAWTGTVAQIVTLTQHEHNIIRSIDPEALIGSPSCSTYKDYDAYWSAGGVKDVDVITIHPYPDVKNNDVAEAVNLKINWLKQLRAKYGLTGKPIWDTESSWGNSANGAITNQDEQAAFVARSLLLHWWNTVVRFNWFEWDSDNDGCLWTPSTELREPGVAYEQVENWMLGATMSGCSMNGGTTYHATYTCDLKRSGSTWVGRAVWWTDGSKSYTAPSQFTQYQTLENSNITRIPSNHQVTIGHEPILLENEDIP
jgi:hypothetical protein